MCGSGLSDKLVARRSRPQNQILGGKLLRVLLPPMSSFPEDVELFVFYHLHPCRWPVATLGKVTELGMGGSHGLATLVTAVELPR